MKKIFLTSLIICFSVLLYSQEVEKDLKKINQAKKLYNSCIELLEKEKYDLALAEIENALIYNPEFIEGLILRARLRYMFDDVNGALDDLSVVSFQNPNNAEALFYNTIFSFNLDTSKRDTLMLNKVIDLGYVRPQVFYYLGLMKLLEGNNFSSLEYFTKAIELKSDYALAYHDRGTANLAIGDLEGAIYDYRQALNYNPNLVMAYDNLGSARKKSGDFEGAIQDYSSALNLDSTYYMALNNRGTTKLDLGDMEGARADFEKALHFKPDYHLALCNLGKIEAKNNNFELAIDFFDQTIAIDSIYGAAYLNRGLANESLGNIDAACFDWKTALEFEVTDAEKYLKECNE